MPDFLKAYRGALIVFLVLLLPGISLVLSRGGPGRGPVDRVLISTVGLLQEQGHYGLGFVEDIWQDYVALRDLKRENDYLRKKLARYREERARLIGVLQENARLRRLLEVKEDRPDLKLRVARVIARDMTPYFRVLRVKLDSRQLDFTVKPQMAVVSHEGVVGQVIEVYDDYADVMLVADPRSKVDIVSQRSRTRGMVHGLGHKKDYQASMAHLRRKDEIATGDEVVTSGKGGIFPQELLVGEVKEVDNKSYGLEQSAVVEPSVDFGRLEEVFIVTGERSAGLRP